MNEQEIRQEMDRIEKAATQSLNDAYEVRKEPRHQKWCVNWGDFGVVDVTYELSLNGGNVFTVHVEEAAPENEDLASFLMAWMEQHGFEESPIFVFNW